MLRILSSDHDQYTDPSLILYILHHDSTICSINHRRNRPLQFLHHFWIAHSGIWPLPDHILPDFDSYVETI